MTFLADCMNKPPGDNRIGAQDEARRCRDYNMPVSRSNPWFICDNFDPFNIFKFRLWYIRRMKATFALLANREVFNQVQKLAMFVYEEPMGPNGE
jgi:hypothetical protein